MMTASAKPGTIPDMVELETDCGVNLIEFIYEQFGKDFGRTYIHAASRVEREQKVDSVRLCHDGLLMKY